MLPFLVLFQFISEILPKLVVSWCRLCVYMRKIKVYVSVYFIKTDTLSTTTLADYVLPTYRTHLKQTTKHDPAYHHLPTEETRKIPQHLDKASAHNARPLHVLYVSLHDHNRLFPSRIPTNMYMLKSQLRRCVQGMNCWLAGKEER